LHNQRHTPPNKTHQKNVGQVADKLFAFLAIPALPRFFCGGIFKA